MDRIDLQIELCRSAVRLLRENCRNKLDSDNILDMAAEVLMKTFDAIGESHHETKEI